MDQDACLKGAALIQQSMADSVSQVQPAGFYEGVLQVAQPALVKSSPEPVEQRSECRNAPGLRAERLARDGHTGGQREVSDDCLDPRDK